MGHKLFLPLLIGVAMIARGATHQVMADPVTHKISKTQLQNTIDSACVGDRIEIEAHGADQVTLDLGFNQVIELQTPPCGSDVDGNYVEITTTQWAKLPAAGTRITPAYKPLMAVIRRDPSAGNTTPETSPVFRTKTGKAYRAKHWKFRGIMVTVPPYPSGWAFPNIFSGDPANNGYGNNRRVSATVFELGNPQTGWYGLPSTSGAYEGPVFLTGETHTFTTTSLATGATEIPLASAEWVEPGMTLVILNGTNGNEWVPVQSVNYATNTVTSSRALTRGTHASGRAVMQWMTDMGRDWPHDIVIQHCIIMGDWIARLEQGIRTDATSLVIRDNFIDAILAYGASGSDSRAIIGNASVGPATIENNYLHSATENIMWGAGSPSANVEAGANGPMVVRYNYLPHIIEREGHGLWNRQIAGRSGAFGIPGLVLRGRHVAPSTDCTAGTTVCTAYTSTGWWLATNSGIIGAEPTWPSSPVTMQTTVTSGEVTFVYTAGPTGKGNYIPWVKNNFELKSSQRVAVNYNVMDGYPDGHRWNGTQYTAINLKADSQAGCSNTGPVDTFPNCYPARLYDIDLSYNKILTQAGGIQVGGSSSGLPIARQGKIRLSNNLFEFTHPVVQTGSTHLMRLNAVRNVPMTDVQIENNTFVTRFTSSTVQYGIETVQERVNLWTGSPRFAGNIFPRPNGNIPRTGAYSLDGYRALGFFPCQAGGTNDPTVMDTFRASDCTPEQFGKNAILGAGGLDDGSASANWPQDRVITNRSATSQGSPDWTYTGAQATGVATCSGVGCTPPPLFVDYTNRNYRVHPEHLFGRGGVLGADLSRIPDIHLSVEPLDTQVLFRYTVTSPIRDIPCVVEVWSGSPDYQAGTYAGELSDIGTYYRQDADDADRFIRHGLTRMLVVGHSVPLSASTQYYYRLQCGGDTRHGTFTTLAALSSTKTITISQNGAAGATWGTSYSRATDTIASAAAMSCNGTTCTASPNAGDVVYLRRTGRPVEAIAIR